MTREDVERISEALGPVDSVPGLPKNMRFPEVWYAQKEDNRRVASAMFGAISASVKALKQRYTAEQHPDAFFDTHAVTAYRWRLAQNLRPWGDPTQGDQYPGEPIPLKDFPSEEERHLVMGDAPLVSSTPQVHEVPVPQSAPPFPSDEE